MCFVNYFCTHVTLNKVFVTINTVCKRLFWIICTTQVDVYVSENEIKMENYLLVNFDENWPKTLYSSTGTFLGTLKIHKKSNFDRNQLKNSTQHKDMHMYLKKLLKWRILSYSFLMKFGQSPCTIVQELWPIF